MAKVIKAFRDKQDSSKLYTTKKNNEYKGSREQELIEKGYLESTETALSDLTVKELKEIAKEKEIDGYADMKKAELIDSLNE